MNTKKLEIAIEQLQKVHRDMNDCANRFILKDAIDQLQEQVKLFTIPCVVGSSSKSELIVKLIEKIYSESDNKESLEYHSKMACGYGMVTLDIKIE